MRDPLAPFVAQRGAAVLDGGLASEIAARGVDLGDALWSARALIDRPDVLAAVHRAYLEAGADVIETATYQATIPGFAAFGIPHDEAVGLIRSGVALAVRERDAFWARAAKGASRERPLVAASIGSYGAFLADGSEYRGAYDIGPAALADWHRERLRIVEACSPDLVAFETIPSLDEAAAIARLLAEADGPPAWVSFQARDAAHLADGSPIEESVARVAREARVVAVGVNCVEPGLIAPLIARCASVTAKGLVAYPNRGGTWDAASKHWSGGESRIPFDRLAREWRDAGARLIGGCCRTTPADIRAISAAL